MNLVDIDPELIEPQRLAGCVIDSLILESRGSRLEGLPGISTRDALIALEYEATLVAVAAANLANGTVLQPDDLARLLVAASRISVIREAAR